MTRYQLHLHTRPVPGAEAEYHRWYDEVHLADVVGLAGFLSGERLAPVLLAHDQPVPDSYLAVYDIETDDLAAVLGQMRTAGLEISPALDTGSVRMEVFRQITPKLAAS